MKRDWPSIFEKIGLFLLIALAILARWAWMNDYFKHN